jgi:hypothetical protein
VTRGVTKSSPTERFSHAAAGIGLVIGLLSILPYFGLHLDYVPGDVLDNRLCNYLLEHGYKWITGQESASFFDAPFFYPVRETIRYSENFIGSLAFYVPWRLLGFDRENSFQIWIVLGYVLNYLAAAWVLKKLRFHWFAVAAGAYVFAFSQAVVTHSWHIQLQYRFAIPLAWYFLHRFLEHFQAKHLLASLSFLAWQLYCNVYEGYFLALFLAAVVLVELLTRPVIRAYRQTATGRSVLVHLSIVLGFVFVVGILARHYVSTASDTQLIAQRQAEVITMLPRPVSYLTSRAGSSEMGWMYDSINLPLKHEHIMFVGFMPWIGVLVLLAARKRAGVKPEVTHAVLAMLLVMGLTLYWNGYSFYLLLTKIPGVAGIRAMTRIIMILIFPFALATAQILHLCLERLSRAKPAVAGVFVIVMAAALLFENHTAPYRYSKEEGRERIRMLDAQLPSQLPPHAVLAYLYTIGGATPKDDSDAFEIDAMLAAQARNISTVNGYSATQPAGFLRLHSCSDIRLTLDDLVRQNESFPLQNVSSQIVTAGSPADAPCEPYLTRTASETNAPLPDDAFRAMIDVAAPPVVTARAGFSAKLRITNQSRVRWLVRGLPSGQFRLRMSCQWLTSGSKVLAVYPNRFDLPYDLQPNESAVVAAELTAPAQPGAYTLECDAVQELVHWFRDMGSNTARTLVQVRREASTPAIRGTLDLVDGQQIAGWAWDQDNPDAPVQVEIRDGANRLATTAANLFRKDLLDAGIGNGAHGFSIANPVAADGKKHTLHVLASGTNVELDGSPKSFPPQ